MSRSRVTVCCILTLATFAPAFAPAVGSAAAFVDLSANVGYGWCTPFDVNANDGDAVVGFGLGSYKAFLYTGGTAGSMYDLSANFPGAQSTCLAINSSGQIAAGANPPTNGYYYTGGTSGTSTALLLPGNGTGGNRATDIDDLGNVVGYAKNSSGAQVAFVYSGGSMYELPRPTSPLDPPYVGVTGNPVTGYGQGKAIGASAFNSHGQVVGYAQYQPDGIPLPLPLNHAVIWNYSITGGVLNATATDINASVGNSASGSSALAINNEGQVFGQYNGGPGLIPSNAANTYLYNINTNAFTDLGALRTYAATGGGYCGLLNMKGQVVGEENVGTPDVPVWHAAIWDASNGLRDLNTVYASTLAAWSAANGGTTMVLNAATAIGDDGSIVGIGTDSLGHTGQGFLIRETSLDGDANLDGKVDINDLTIVLDNYNRTSGMTWGTGDFNGDGKVDINDLTIVLDNYNQSIGSPAGGVSAVPEPGTWALLAAGLVGLLTYASRKWK